MAGLVLLLVASGCAGDRKSYSQAEAQQAFRTQGFHLTKAVGKMRETIPTNEPILVPRSHVPFSRQPFLVFVFRSDPRAEELYDKVVGRWPFEVFRGNILATSVKGGLGAKQRRRIRAALDNLPKRRPYRPTCCDAVSDLP